MPMIPVWSAARSALCMFVSFPAARGLGSVPVSQVDPGSAAFVGRSSVHLGATMRRRRAFANPALVAIARCAKIGSAERDFQTLRDQPAARVEKIVLRRAAQSAASSAGRRASTPGGDGFDILGAEQHGAIVQRLRRRRNDPYESLAGPGNSGTSRLEIDCIICCVARVRTRTAPAARRQCLARRRVSRVREGIVERRGDTP